MEREIENLILNFLKSKDVFCWKNYSTGIFDPVKKVYRKNTKLLKGTSDILGIIQGKPLAIEVKSASGSLTTYQRKFIDDFNKQGGIAFVARSISDVVDELKVRGIHIMKRPVEM